MHNNLLTHLGSEPINGSTLANVCLLRLDRSGGLAPGNKSFKLQKNIDQARRLGVQRLVSFGGAWSNHLHALAAVGRDAGLATVGIVRGEATAENSPMLADARAWGMQLVNVSRTEYRRRNDVDYLEQIKQQFAPCLVIPEGGANLIGAEGAMAIAKLIRQVAPEPRRVVLSVGTGTTLAGVAAGLGDCYEVVGISALKGATDLEQRVEQLLTGISGSALARWHIEHDYHCGGFARVNQALRDFMLSFEQVHSVPLEPVYTGKMLFAIQQLQRSGQWQADTPVLAIHTGGLQGRRGYAWLADI